MGHNYDCTHRHYPRPSLFRRIDQHDGFRDRDISQNEMDRWDQYRDQTRPYANGYGAQRRDAVLSSWDQYATAAGGRTFSDPNYAHEQFMDNQEFWFAMRDSDNDLNLSQQELLDQQSRSQRQGGRAIGVEFLLAGPLTSQAQQGGFASNYDYFASLDGNPNDFSIADGREFMRSKEFKAYREANTGSYR